MPRDINDSAAHRLSKADQQLSADQLRAVLEEWADVRELRQTVTRQGRAVARRRRAVRIGYVALAVSGCSLLTGLVALVVAWGLPAAVLRVDVVSGVLLLIAGSVAAAALPRRRNSRMAVIETELDDSQQKLRFLNSLTYPTLRERRSLYREDVAGFIEQHRADSRWYRLVHNMLQNLITIGSASTTTVAALETRNAFTWQNISIVAIGFTVTLAAAFTGYYKYRERSYFLLQTADAIEEEANAFSLGIGMYSDFGADQEEDALKTFTQRVEDHRNEQRRRQQQLDQPADQAPPTGTTSPTH